ncbi:MAG: bifunctional phosphoribosylaminoimidazolecarboxamide formyltransferase/IMP cyclohydrolase [Anaerolineales bacterium]|nr:bifunctional phosphoribosylaminoimidazolecarboxamide formyltransferase/IMP cyclohydrolase [Anaerolineales bacterium]
MPIALFSVWDKAGLTDFAAALGARGWELVASGGTARALAEADLPVRQVSELTGEPEMLDGRVKTLHPAVHAGLLARDTPEDRAELEAHGWRPIDLVAINLYPFEEIVALHDVTLEQAVEHIDIGGVTLLRAAAKNFARVTVLCDPADYPLALDTPDPAAFRQRMAHKAFVRTAVYDAAIETYLARLVGGAIPLRLTYYPSLELRYGENPHQQATFYSSGPSGAPMGGELLQGKPLSYNNLLDLDAAWRAAAAYAEPAVVVVKHTSPCGIAIAPNAAEAVSPAIASDPVSAFGSVIACNRVVNEAFVEALGDLFVECLVATGFNDGARQCLGTQQNLRLLKMPATELTEHYELRSVVGGLLWQTLDFGDPTDAPPWRVVTRRKPSERELDDMRFAWQACQSVKSNAVVLAHSDSQCRFTVGIGGGQPNRIDCVRIAGERAGERAAGAVLASDAFFPFPDGVETASTLGVTAVVQPGGSVRDAAVIKTADDMGLAMVFTGVRHFRH